MVNTPRRCRWHRRLFGSGGRSPRNLSSTAITLPASATRDAYPSSNPAIQEFDEAITTPDIGSPGLWNRSVCSTVWIGDVRWGGIQLLLGGRLRAWRRDHCKHTRRVVVRTAGMERSVCESCGHVSFESGAEALNEVKRSDFARASEIEATDDIPDFGRVEEVEVP